MYIDNFGTLLNFKVIDRHHMGFWVFCFFDAAVTRGQYLALSKA